MKVSERAFDLVVLAVLAPLLLPLVAIVALALLAGQGRPVLFGQTRMRGVDAPFTLWKFRTMRPDPGDAGVSGGDKAARITPLGRLLRRTRLDELPQAWNVLRGDIRLVGPRPPLPVYVADYPGLYGEVLKSRPGITGLATLAYHRSEERILARCATAEETDAVYRRRCIPRKARLDLIYQRNRSVCFDLVLLGRTVARVLRR